jgi:hypothetical protein
VKCDSSLLIRIFDNTWMFFIRIAAFKLEYGRILINKFIDTSGSNGIGEEDEIEEEKAKTTDQPKVEEKSETCMES